MRAIFSRSASAVGDAGSADSATRSARSGGTALLAARWAAQEMKSGEIKAAQTSSRSWCARRIMVPPPNWCGAWMDGDRGVLLHPLQRKRDATRQAVEPKTTEPSGCGQNSRKALNTRGLRRRMRGARPRRRERRGAHARPPRGTASAPRRRKKRAPDRPAGRCAGRRDR